MELESEANIDAPGPWQADQPSRWQRLTGALLPTSPLNLPASDMHAQGISRADHPLGSNSRSTAEGSMAAIRGSWQQPPFCSFPAEGYLEPALLPQHRAACAQLGRPARWCCSRPGCLSEAQSPGLLRAESVSGVAAGQHVMAGCGGRLMLTLVSP